MAQNITLMGASYENVPAVVLPTTGGGIAKFMDTTGATATHDMIMQGYTAYVNSVLVVGTGTGGGGINVRTATGTFTGNGTRQVTVSCAFEPDLVYFTSNPGTSASSGVVAAIIARGLMAASRYRNNSTTNSHYAVIDITGMNTGGTSYSFRATYENSTVTLYCFSSGARCLFTNNRTYSYTFIKYTA